MKPIYLDLHIHTSEDEENLNQNYDVDLLLSKIRRINDNSDFSNHSFQEVQPLTLAISNGGLSGNCCVVLSIVICCILIVSSSKTATTHSGNR